MSLNTMVVYFDESKKNFQTITPLRQGVGWKSEERFDNNWRALAEHVSGGKYFKFELV